MKCSELCASLHPLRTTYSNARCRWLACALACAGVLVVGALAAEKPASDRVQSALVEAERLAMDGKWREALKAGDRLRMACRDLRGELHPDTALAELFLGEVRGHLGERSLAESHFRRALAIQEQVLPRDAPELVTTLTRLGAELKDQQRHDEAAGLLQRALDLQARLHGENEGTAVACLNVARVLRHTGDFARAAALVERALRIQRRELGGTAPETLAGLQELARLREAAGEMPAAEIAAAEWVAGAEAVERFSALATWARLAERQENYAAAETRYRAALAAGEPLLIPDAPELTRVSAQLGWCLVNLNRTAEAKPLLERALENRKRDPSPEHSDTAESHRQLGWLLRVERDFAAARPHFERALAIREKAFGANDPATLESLAELGDLQALAGDFDQAAELHERHRYRTEEITGPASAETAAASHALALIYESAKRWTQAVDAALRCLRLAENRAGPAAPETLDALLLLSRICAAAGALEPALTQYARLAAWFALHPETAPERRAELQRSYAIAALRAGRTEAEALFRESRRLHVAALGAAHPDTLRTMTDLWTFFVQTRRPARAVEMARELAAETERTLGAEAPATAEVWERFGQLQITLGDRDAAMTAFRRALESRRKRTGTAELSGALAKAAGYFEEVRDFARAAELRLERLGLVQRAAFGSAEEAAAAGELGVDYFRLRDFLPARGMFEHQRKLAAPDSAEALAATARLGDVAVAAGDLKTAVRERERLVAGCARRFGAAHAEHGRAILLLGEAQISADELDRAEASFAEVQRILQAAQPDDSLLARVAADRAVVALRRSREDEARRWTRDALTGAMEQDEAMAEVLTRLGDAWADRGDAKTAEGPLAAALAILTQVAGDQDEPALALLLRVGRMRLQNGRPGAAALLERARAGNEALFGSESPALAEVLGWLTLAALAEGQPADARTAADRRVKLMEKLGNHDPGALAEAKALRAWANCGATDGAVAEIADFVDHRWPWLGGFSRGW